MIQRLVGALRQKSPPFWVYGVLTNERRLAFVQVSEVEDDFIVLRTGRMTPPLPQSASLVGSEA